jgi:stearoyl-CoA desaturase (Delta-9 desaturase)
MSQIVPETGLEPGTCSETTALDSPIPAEVERVDWAGSIGFIAIHVACLLAFFVGFSWTALIACLAFYVIRMFAITAGYHRYFSHRSFKTSRAFQFVLAWLGCSAAQKGPLWWAAHHRHHHRHSDTDEDLHSPGMRGIWWAHAGWILCKKYAGTNLHEVRDLLRFRELQFLNRWHIIPPVVLAVVVFAFGAGLNAAFPQLGTSGAQMLVWGFFISTTLLYHGTFTINSLAHVLGKRRYETTDSSRNSALLAVITLGEGWHNNHHHYPGSERQGFFWWEIDVSHYLLRMLSWVGLVSDLRSPPATVLAAGREADRARR